MTTNDTSPLAEKLQRIADHERGLRLCPRDPIRRAHPGVRRLLSPLWTESGSLAVPQDAGPGSGTAGFAGTAPYYYGCQIGVAPADRRSWWPGGKHQPFRHEAVTVGCWTGCRTSAC
jgi:hypothetical protein